MRQTMKITVQEDTAVREVRDGRLSVFFQCQATSPVYLSLRNRYISLHHMAGVQNNRYLIGMLSVKHQLFKATPVAVTPYNGYDDHLVLGPDLLTLICEVSLILIFSSCFFPLLETTDTAILICKVYFSLLLISMISGLLF